MLPEPSNAGASAKREYQKRRARLTAERVERWGPTLGTAVDLFSGEPLQTSSWAKGADGEEAAGRFFDQRLSSSRCEVLHDRSIPGTRRNIDHIIVGPPGVLVVDTKNVKGKVRMGKEGFGSRRREILEVAGRDRTKMIDGVIDQVERVRLAVESVAPVDVPVDGVICWWKADGLPAFGMIEIRGVKVLRPSAIVKLANGPIRLGETRIEEVRRNLSACFPPA